MKHVLITGARGFVGASMIEYFIENTEYIIYYIKRPLKEDDRLKQINFKYRVFEWNGENIDIILHAAGNPSSLSWACKPRDASRPSGTSYASGTQATGKSCHTEGGASTNPHLRQRVSWVAS